ncbi:hypothetical protein YC2023_010717 [Brassica napus]
MDAYNSYSSYTSLTTDIKHYESMYFTLHERNLTKMRLRGDWWRRILRVAIDVDEE